MESELGLAGSGMQRGKEKAEKKPKKEVKSIHAERVNGGYKATHHHSRPEHHPPEEHGGMKSKEELMAHMDEHMPEGAGGEGGAAQEEAVGE